MRKESRKLLPAALAALLLGSPAGAQAPVNIGAAAAVAGVVNAKAPGAAVGRVLQSGKPVFLNDHVTTDANGRLQVLLLDETVFTLGPNSDMVLDEFVYDPATSAGKVSAKVAKGVFRFVTGKVARKNPADMKVGLPVGTIGIRGTMVVGQASGSDATVILLGPGAQNDAGEAAGAVAVSGGGSEVVITRPGFGTSISGGGAPTPPSDMVQQAQQMLAQVQPQPEPEQQGGGQGGGSQGGGSQGGGTQGGGGGAAGGSTAEQSGGATAAGQSALGDSQVQAGMVSLLSQDMTFAAQTVAAITDSVSTWDQVRGAETGLAMYQGNGLYSCTQGCGGGGPLTFTLEVDFGNRTFGGGTSVVQFAGGPLSATTSVSQTDFSALTGSASAALGTDSAFSGTSVSFLNRDGVAAKDARVDVNYSYFDGTTTYGATGRAVGERGPYIPN